MNQAAYDAWRKTIPFSDEAIADQLDRDAAAIEIKNDQDRYHVDRLKKRAARCRAGFVSARDVRQVYDALIKSCVVCGKKALYRSGSIGLCSDHRFVKSTFVREKIARQERASAFLAAERKRADYIDLDHKKTRTGKFSAAAGRRRRRSCWPYVS